MVTFHLFFPINHLSTHLHEKQKFQYLSLEVSSFPNKLSQSPRDQPSQNKDESSHTPDIEQLESVPFATATDSLCHEFLLPQSATAKTHAYTIS